MSKSLFDFVRVKRQTDTLEPWKPRVTDASAWPPNYRGAMLWRMQTLQKLRADRNLLLSARAFYAANSAEFICHWVDTYDPRRTDSKWLPFVFFDKQGQFIEFLDDLREKKQSGLVEKCRDVGATWGCAAYSVHSWLFRPNDAIGWGSRKEQLVDKLGDPDSIFEKMRLIIGRLPEIWRPKRFDTSFMKFVNYDNGSTITGEAGDNIGRGGRKSVYFKDESAHYERPEKIEAALGDNTDVQIDISSVNGLGNVFHRRREAGEIWEAGREIGDGVVRVFIFDWRDHPLKTQKWYDDRRAKYEREGMLHLFAQEVDRNYSAAVLNTIIPSEWIDAAVDAHLRIRWMDKGQLRIGLPPEVLGETWGAGLDVADEGGDRNALALRQSIVWRDADEWGDRDQGITTRRAIDRLQRVSKLVTMQYDCIGVGAGVKTEYNRLLDDKIIDRAQVRLVPWNAGAGVLNPAYRVIPDDDESMLNKDAFANLKAQAWWSLRARFYKTFKNVTEGHLYPIDDMISLDSAMRLLQQIKKELAQPTTSKNSNMKSVIDKKPDGTKSPNLADAGVMMYFPLDPAQGEAMAGSYGV